MTSSPPNGKSRLTGLSNTRGADVTVLIVWGGDQQHPLAGNKPNGWHETGASVLCA